MAASRHLALLVSLAGIGCTAAEVDIPYDQDQDGLLSDEEDALGTDPDDADSDGDGLSDGEEYLEGTDPLDDDDYPYLGGWPIARCDPEPDTSGNDAGEITDNFSLGDQNGQEVDLYDFCGNTVYLVLGAFW